MLSVSGQTATVLMRRCPCAQALFPHKHVHTQARSHAGHAKTGNYCSVVKHHYSLICPLAPSVLLGATLYTIGSAPRTTPPTRPHARTHHPSHKALAYKETLHITPALSLYILHHCLLFLPCGVFSSLFLCSLTMWVRDRSCRLPCITLIYQEAKPYFMLPPHLLPCIRPDEVMNAGSDACPPMLVDYEKEKRQRKFSGKIGRLGFKEKRRKYSCNRGRHRQQRQLRCVFRGKVWGGPRQTPLDSREN